MAFIFYFGNVLINYLQNNDKLSFGCQTESKSPKIGGLTNSKSENSDMAFIFHFDNVLINYSQNSDKSLEFF